MTSSALTFVAFVLVMTSHGAEGVDLTVTEGANGTQVVTAVLNRIHNRCIFSEDRLFLRRASYVASRDGADGDTYLSGQNGGIWKINETQFVATKACSAVPLASPCQTILSELSIDWSGSVTWSDLRKPLYSGLAAALFTLLTLNGTVISGDVTQQARLWASAFGGNETEFIELAGNATNLACSDQMDLVFVLDSSGSVSTASFSLMKSFAADVVEVMEIGPDKVHVANIVYGTLFQVVFGLGDHNTAPDIHDALIATPKLGGGTMTDDAIDQAAVTLYDVSSGARSDAKKVMVLVTDGHSWKPYLTADVAHSLRDRGTTVFAIGVGAYNLTELHVVASSPTCAHVLTLTDFSSIQSILTQIQTSTCDASLIVTPGLTVTGEIPDSPVEVVTQTLNPGPNRNIEANVTCGDLDIFLSYSEPHPSSALYEEHHTATHNNPVTLTTPATLGQGSPIYITVVGSRLSGSEALRYGCTQYVWSIAVQAPDKLIRLINGGSATEGRVEVFTDGSWGTVCDDSFGVDDAIVACRMMGYEGLVPAVYPGGRYGTGSGTVWLDEVGCSGGESSLLVCPHDGLGHHDCGHDQDVGVDCLPPNATTITFVRLVNGSRPSEGRVEVLNGGSWGTVCHDNFDVTDATVVCSMLNYTQATPLVRKESYFGEGSGSIWLDDVTCEGSEMSVLLCDHKGLGISDCTHWDDVGVDCLPDLQVGASTADETAVVAGAVGGVVGAVVVVGGAVVVFKMFAARAARVRNFKFTSRADDGGHTGRSTSRMESDPSDTDPPIPGLLVDAPAMRMPLDTRLPPLVNNNARVFPALRY